MLAFLELTPRFKKLKRRASLSKRLFKVSLGRQAVCFVLLSFGSGSVLFQHTPVSF